MRKLFSILAASCLLAGPAIAAAPGAPTPQIWFNLNGFGKPETYQGWDILFYRPDAPWPEFMNHVTTVGMTTQVLYAIPGDNLAKVVARLKQKHIVLGTEMLAQAYTLPGVDAPAHCGEGVEGYYAPEVTALIAAKLKRAGGELQFIAMDEPLWFGHYYNEKNACHSSIENVADRVAANIREYQKVFPDVEIGDIEPFPSITAQPGWQNDYRQWLDAFRRKIGKPMAYTYIDIDWNRTDWRQGLRSFVSFAHDVHMPIGIIYNAAPPNKTMTNQEWLNNAQQNFTYIERTLDITPRWAMFASWVRFPGRFITVRDGPGLDYLVKQYLQLHGVK
jgi:hypothetical protein